MFEEMVTNSKEFYQSLGIPYRIVVYRLRSLNLAGSIKYDLEAWFPFQGEFKELVSTTNCTDYRECSHSLSFLDVVMFVMRVITDFQFAESRKLEVRCGLKKHDQTNKVYVHMLNGTLCATERALCCLVENYQTPEVCFIF
jgi:seryl-tRNA synthetase